MTALLLRPVPAPITRRVANFGIELEALNQDQHHYREVAETVRCGCGDRRCTGSWSEYHSRPTEGLLAYLDAFHVAGLTDFDPSAATELHPYHCGCESCRYDRSAPLMAVQADSSVGVELVSRILDATSADDIAQVRRLGVVFDNACRAARYSTTLAHSCGDHIHVSFRGDDDGSRPFYDETILAARRLMTAFVAAGTVRSWDEVAGGGLGQVRRYNGAKPELSLLEAPRDGDGRWVRLRNRTIEYRMWNTPAGGHGERIGAHVAISLAITRWAYTQVLRDRAAVAALNFRDFSAIVAENRDAILENVALAMPEGLRDVGWRVLKKLEFTAPALANA